MIKPWATIQEVLGIASLKETERDGKYQQWGEDEDQRYLRVYDTELHGDPFTDDWEIPIAKYAEGSFKNYEVLTSGMTSKSLWEAVQNLRSFLKGSN